MIPISPAPPSNHGLSSHCDPRDATIAEQKRHIQRLEATIAEYVSDFRERATTITDQAETIATLREALVWIAASTALNGGSMALRLHASKALAATEEK